MRITLFLRIIQNRKNNKISLFQRGYHPMNKISVYSLDHYNKTVIKSIMEKYAKPEMEAMRLFLGSETH